MVIYDFDPNNLPAEFLQAIGLVTAAAAQTEDVLQKFIGGLLQIDSIEVIALTAQMSALLKDQIARSLIELNATSAAMIDHVDDLLDAIADATARRNVWVHTSYARHPDTGEVYSIDFKARGSLKVSKHPVTTEKIKEDAAAIYKAGMRLMAFMSAFDMHPVDRTRPLHETLNRKKVARKARQAAATASVGKG